MTGQSGLPKSFFRWNKNDRNSLNQQICIFQSRRFRKKISGWSERTFSWMTSWKVNQYPFGESRWRVCSLGALAGWLINDFMFDGAGYL